MPETRNHLHGQPPLATAFSGTCPRCGEGRLFSGVLSPAAGCGACGLDYAFIDTGDGPAVFVIFVLGVFVLGLALWFESLFAPPLWLHFVMWVPLVAVLVIFALRFTKAFMIGLQYKTAAAQGRIADP